MKRYFTGIILMLFSVYAFAQDGLIRGSVIDNSNGEAMFGVTILAKGTTYGAISDFDGKFEIKLPAGTYDVQFSFVSYETITIPSVVIKPGVPVIFDGVRLNEAVSQLSEVVITAEVIRNSESGLNTIKRKSVNLLDGVSAANFRKIGDSDASEAAKRITGVSVESGKYLYVRGLGDRYTKTTLNNVDIPGLDPDRNSIQMDIFPTSLIDNMIVLKTSLAQLPSDFTGGIVNIETKDFPDERIFDISFGLGYNPSMHFNNDFIAGDKSKTDFLGYDDGRRALPDGARSEVIPTPVSGATRETVNSFLRSFNPVLGPTRQQSFMDYSLGVSLADQLNIFKSKKLGYIFSATYKSSTAYFNDVMFGEYQRFIDPNRNELRYATVQNGVKGEQNVLAGLLGGLAYKGATSKYKFTALHLQNGLNTTGQFFVDNDGEAVGQSGYIAFSNNIEYNQRGLTNLMLNGEHHIADNKWEIDWRVSSTLSNISDPDVRKTTFTISNLDTTFSAGAGGNPNRIWRALDEVNHVGKIDISKIYRFRTSEAKLRFGASHLYKERDYEILSFDLQFFGSQPSFGMDPNRVLNPENLFPNGTLYFSSGNNVPNPNQYNSSVLNTAFYVSNEFNPMTDLKLVVGLRGENYLQRHTGRDVEFASFGVGNNLDNDIVLDSFDLFPSLNMVYSLKEEQNFRFSFSKTIARPSFKELSFAQIIDPLTNRIFNGGLFRYSDWDGRLTETRINNLDLRWEMFKRSGDLISLSAFFKTFDDPIELVRIQEQQTSTEYQPRNVGQGRVIGAEIEFKKRLDFIGVSILDKFAVSSNVTVAKSTIEMTEREFNSRKQYEKIGETIKNTRQMAGQAPFIINTGISYENVEKGLDAGLFYNVKGSTLFIVGAGLFPDVYTEPFHSLNFNLNLMVGNSKKSSVTFNVSNILNDVREEVYRGFNTQDQVFTRFNPGTAFSFGFKYAF